MNRHLLPDEIDSLLDGEVGFGTAPLKAHVRSCPECRAELEAARMLVRRLEHLPLLLPSPVFQQRVMMRVQIYVPWYVTAVDTVRGWLPRSRLGQLATGAGLLSTATALTLATLWMLTQLDTVMFAVDLAVERGREVFFGAISGLVTGVVGEAGAQALRAAGPLQLLMALGLFLLLGAGTARAMRAMARVPRGR